MVDPTTVNRGYAVPVTGTDVGTWGTVLNADLALIDNNFGGVSSVALSNVNVTLNSTQYQCGTIRLTGTLTGNVNVTFPAVQGWWTIDNQTTGAFVAVLTIGSGNVIATEQGQATDILIDGTNVKFRNLGKIGEYWDYAGSSVPLWVTACTVPPYLNCDGTTFSAVTYPYLNTILGGTMLPQSKGNLRASLNQGSGNITTAGSGIDGNTRFSAGGAQNVLIGQVNIPIYNMAVSGTMTGTTGDAFSVSTLAGNTGPASFPYWVQAGAGRSVIVPSTGLVIGSNGSGTALNKMPPTYIGGITMIRAA